VTLRLAAARLDLPAQVMSDAGPLRLRFIADQARLAQLEQYLQGLAREAA
jgi:hypothetical protein